MKIGLITWHYYPNVGSCLQAFALQQHLLSKGYYVEFINYREMHRPKLERLRTFLCKFDSFMPKTISDKLHYKFVYFINSKLRLGKDIKDYAKLRQEGFKYDVYICGSDQIWAPSVFNKAYFLEFVDAAKKRISYAPSIGLPIIPDRLRSTYKNLISKFDYVSVREEAGKNLLKELGIDSQVVCDPTFLIKADKWVSDLKLKDFQNQSRPFVFFYFLGKNKNHREMVQHIAKLLGLKTIGFSLFDEDKKYCDEFVKSSGPIEFLEYIKNSTLVLTDSFHGTAFSLIFNKDFYVFERFIDNDPNNQNSRIYNILDKLNLKERLLRSNISAITHVDYTQVNPLVNKFRENSIEYLDMANNG